MNLAEDLQRLKQLRDSGELTEEQYEAEKNRVLDACVHRIENWRPRRTPARITPRVIRGTVRSLVLADLNKTATLWLDQQKVTIRELGHPISIADGDRVLVVGNPNKESFQAMFYVDESNGDNSVDESRKKVRKMIVAGAAGMLGGLAVLITVAVAAIREPAFLSAGGFLRLALYLISIAVALGVEWISVFILWAGGFLNMLIGMIDGERPSGGAS
jgi:hypothetical protein